MIHTTAMTRTSTAMTRISTAKTGTDRAARLLRNYAADVGGTCDLVNENEVIAPILSKQNEGRFQRPFHINRSLLPTGRLRHRQFCRVPVSTRCYTDSIRIQHQHEPGPFTQRLQPADFAPEGYWGPGWWGYAYD